MISQYISKAKLILISSDCQIFICRKQTPL